MFLVYSTTLNSFSNFELCPNERKVVLFIKDVEVPKNLKNTNCE